MNSIRKWKKLDFFTKEDYKYNKEQKMENNGVILFVDDEENILKSIRRSLMDEPYEMFFANSGKEALKILEENKVDVIVTDMRMPEMNGLELLEIVKKKYPDIVRIVLTGYAQVSTLIAAINSGQIYRYLVKPWKLEAEFKPAIRQALEHHRLMMERNKMIKELKFKTIELQKQIKEKEELIKKIEESNRKKKEILSILSAKTIPFIEEAVYWIDELSKNSNMELEEHILKELEKLKNRAKQVIDVLLKIKDIF